MSEIDKQLNWIKNSMDHEKKDSELIEIGSNIIFYPATGLVLFNGNIRLRYLDGKLKILGGEGTTEPPTKHVVYNIKKQLDNYITNKRNNDIVKDTEKLAKKGMTKEEMIKDAAEQLRKEEERGGINPEEL